MNDLPQSTLTDWRAIPLPKDVVAGTLYVVARSLGASELAHQYRSHIASNPAAAFDVSCLDDDLPFDAFEAFCAYWQGDDGSHDLAEADRLRLVQSVAMWMLRPFESYRMAIALKAHFAPSIQAGLTQLAQAGEGLRIAYEAAAIGARARGESTDSLPDNRLDAGSPGGLGPQAILDAFPQGLICVGRDGGVQYCNRLAQRLLASTQTASDGGDVDIAALIDAFDLTQEVAALTDYGLAFEKRHVISLSGYTSDVVISVQGYPVHQMNGYVLLLRDVLGESAVHQTTAEVGHQQVFHNVVGALAHEFNNVLLGVRGHSARLREILPPDSSEYGLVSQLDNASRHMNTLVDGLLMLVRGRVEPFREPIDCCAVTAEVVRSIRSELPSSIALAYNCLNTPYFVMMEEAHLDYVLRTLIRHARDNIQSQEETRPGRIVVRLRLIDEHIHIVVMDDGPIQSASLLEKCFEPLQCLHYDDRGRGLGLPISRGIVHASGGTLHPQNITPEMFDSIWEGGEPPTHPRAAVHVRLPARQGVARVVDARASTLPASRGVVLVVEDNDIVRDLCVDVLEQEGFVVHTATTGAVAMRVAKQSPPELAIIDVGLPDIDGFEVANVLGIPTILISGNPPALIRRIGELRADSRFLKKPFGIPELLDTVQELLRCVQASR